MVSDRNFMNILLSKLYFGLLQEYDGIFFETSAKMGNNVKESMEAMAR